MKNEPRFSLISIVLLTGSVTGSVSLFLLSSPPLSPHAPSMTTPDALRDADYIADASNIPYEVHDDDGLSDHHETWGHLRRREIQAKAKMVFLDRLQRDFDIMIYCELSALYYME